MRFILRYAQQIRETLYYAKHDYAALCWPINADDDAMGCLHDEGALYVQRKQV